MATTPTFSSVPRAAAALLGAAETNLQVPTTTSTVFTAGASGSKIEEVVVEASNTTLVATTVAGLVYVFLHDGTTFHLFDTIVVSAVTASATAQPYRSAIRYTNLTIPTAWSVRASQSIAGNASLLKFHVLGADF